MYNSIFRESIKRDFVKNKGLKALKNEIAAAEKALDCFAIIRNDGLLSDSRASSRLYNLLAFGCLPHKFTTALVNGLTAREREIIQFVAEGLTTKQIALRLGISPKTADAARRHTMNKLCIDNVAQLTKYAIRVGLTSV